MINDKSVRYMRYKGILFCLWLVVGCSSNFVNERTSKISSIDNTCLDSDVWEFLSENYSLDSTTSSQFIHGAKLISKEPFSTEVYFFSDSPSELIAISKNHYLVRYVYNPKISSEVLNGFSQELNVKERKRIMRRLYSVLNKFQCDDGIKKSKEFINAIEVPKD